MYEDLRFFDLVETFEVNLICFTLYLLSAARLRKRRGHHWLKPSLKRDREKTIKKRKRKTKGETIFFKAGCGKENICLSLFFIIQHTFVPFFFLEYAAMKLKKVNSMQKGKKFSFICPVIFSAILPVSA